MKIHCYIKNKLPLLFLYGLVFVLLACSFALYRLPLSAVAYPMGLGLIPVIVYLIIDYRAEKKRFDQVRELEEKIRDLQQELSDDQEKTQRRMDYYNVWAHQIKTPIAAMRLSLEGQDSDFARRLRSDLSRIETYADMVMTYLRLDADSTDYVFREQNLDEIVRGAVRKFSGEFIARKIALHYEPLNEMVLTDEKWLSFVVEQILSNALKYTPSGSISIYMEDSVSDLQDCSRAEKIDSNLQERFDAEKNSQNSQQCSDTLDIKFPGISSHKHPQILCIRDTGIGIAPEDLPRIFDQGFTGYNGRTDKKASGIGLYLCKRICDDLGYQISAESEPGKGTVIRLNLEKEKITS